MEEAPRGVVVVAQLQPPVAQQHPEDESWFAAVAHDVSFVETMDSKTNLEYSSWIDRERRIGMM